LSSSSSSSSSSFQINLPALHQVVPVDVVVVVVVVDVVVVVVVVGGVDQGLRLLWPFHKRWSFHSPRVRQVCHTPQLCPHPKP
jgi:hypothetical protein